MDAHNFEMQSVQTLGHLQLLRLQLVDGSAASVQRVGRRMDLQEAGQLILDLVQVRFSGQTDLAQHHHLLLQVVLLIRQRFDHFAQRLDLVTDVIVLMAGTRMR